MIVVSFGGGTNSTAMLIGMRDREIVPDAITFADTGAELPRTMQHLQDMQLWCSKNDFPAIVTVKKVDFKGDILTLEDNCLQQKMLPSIAYGFKSCSQKYKIQPQDKYFNNLPQSRAVFKDGGKVTKYIGYDADEERRAKILDDEKYTYEYPLIEWGWGRDECIAAIEKEGLPLPHKSACYFCPSSKVSEIKSLHINQPDLMERALKMESNAQLTTVKGLGRNFAWKDVIATDDMFPEHFIDEPCGCYDG